MLALSLAACGGGSPPNPSVLPAPQNEMIEFTPTASGWKAAPVESDLERVSNNGFGYTGEIDVYELTTPAAGRLVFSLSWDSATNVDLIIAADSEGDIRLGGGFSSGGFPEYESLHVTAGQTLFVFVAGWEGDPGDYVLETMLLPSAEPAFALESAPDFTAPIVRNAPLVFTFNKELATDQTPSDKVIVQATGLVATGTWCVEGRDVVFYPRLPETPGDVGAFLPGIPYTLQFAPVALGLRAVTGEYLDETFTFTLVAAPEFVDEDPHNPPLVSVVDHAAADPWAGNPITISVLGALDPNHVAAALFVVDALGNETPVPTSLILKQRNKCAGSLFARLTVEPLVPLPPASVVRLRIPGTVRGISGEPAPHNLLRGPSGEPGFTLDLRTP